LRPFPTSRTATATAVRLLSILACIGCRDDVDDLFDVQPQGGGAQGGFSQGGAGGEPSGPGGAGGGGLGGGAVCAPGDEQACYTGPAGTEGVGLCKGGTRLCGDEGVFGSCDGQVVPGTETCETPDDEDCDGDENEEGPGCVCVPGAVASCYDGPVGTEGVGLCAAGTRTCSPTGQTFGTCLGQTLPAQETCANPADEDCDGQTNETGPDCVCIPGSLQPCYSANAATLDVGICHGGTQSCNPDGLGFGACMGEVTPGAETCNTPEDEDCDGQVNEEGTGCLCSPGAAISCYTGPAGTQGVGVCASGTALCNAEGTALGPCVDEILPGVETCNSLQDDDCDGQINEEGAGCVCVPGEVQPCYTGPTGTQGVGLCAAGSQTCAWHGLGFGVCSGETLPVTETCATASDDDCDGVASFCTGPHLWSHRFGDSQDQAAQRLATDGAGNVVVTGYFEGSIDFGGGPLTSAGDRDIFVVKFDSAGNHLWSKRFGSVLSDAGFGVATDSAGNVVLTGNVRATVDFGGGPLGGGGIFIAKLDASGNHVWSRRYGSSSTDRGYNVATDPSGNVVVIGDFSGTGNFGGTFLTSAGSEDIFVAKLNAAGSNLWSRRFGDTSLDSGVGIATDGQGSVIVTGSFAGTVNFGGSALTSAGGIDIYVAKLNAAGVHVWSKRFGDAQEQAGFGVATDAGNNVLAIGRLRGSADFGGGALSSASDLDAFVARFDGLGNHSWSKRFGGVGDDWGHGLVVDAAGHVSISGYFANTIDFGGGPLTSAGNHDIYVAKLDSLGSQIWSKRFGDPTFQYSYSLATDAADNLFMTGQFAGTVDFGGGPLSSSGASDAMVLKLGP